MITSDGYFIADHPAWSVFARTRDAPEHRLTCQNGLVYRLQYNYAWSFDDKMLFTVECWGPEGRERISGFTKRITSAEWQKEYRRARHNPELYLMEGLL